MDSFVTQIPEHLKNIFKGFRFTPPCATARQSDGGESLSGDGAAGRDNVDFTSFLPSSDSGRYSNCTTSSYYTAKEDTPTNTPPPFGQQLTPFSTPLSTSTPIVNNPPEYKRQSILHRSSRKSGKFREQSHTQILKKMVAPPTIARKRSSSALSTNKIYPTKIPRRVELAKLSEKELANMVKFVPKPEIKSSSFKSQIPHRIQQAKKCNSAGDLNCNGSQTSVNRPTGTNSSRSRPFSPWAVVSVRPFKLRRKSSLHRAQAKLQKDDNDPNNQSQ